MGFHGQIDDTAEWLNHLQPEGLVVGPNVLRKRQLTPIRQTPLDTEEVATVLGLSRDASREEDRHFVLRDTWAFFETILSWPAHLVAGAPGGPQVSSDLDVSVPEGDTVLMPDMAILWRGQPTEDVPAQALVLLHPELDPDGRNQFSGSEWEASPHQRLERLLRETGIGVGILVARNTIRLVHAPRGETAGWISWPLAPLARVEGRPMLAGLKLCLSAQAFFTGAIEERLRPLLRESRESQNEVSDKLSGQVLGALHELMRGIHAADPKRIERLAETHPHHLYEGLLTCLMRLVFLLYAEDRDLLPSSKDPQLKLLWESGYSIKTLYARLSADAALNEDTMDQRRGGWGQLLAVFRLIHGGHPQASDWVTARGGKLFDPEEFPFLEGRDIGEGRDRAVVKPVSDGCILRILHGLMTVDGRTIGGEKIRERLSYRSLDVESIGSVYETVMGFTACRAGETMIALRDEKKLPTFVGLDTLLAMKPGDRQKWLKDHAVKLSAKQAKAAKEAATVADLVAAFASLVDLRASPDGHTIGAGTPYLQPTEERRRSGSHYTPRSLTEPIVRHALEPAFERIGPRAAPEAVLSLKVLDPACGSGAFLVEACRQLGARLEQAWEMHKAEKPAIPADEDEALHARRLVAQRCLYGVDRNPMAVDLAKLSLWLATLASEHEFTFLDHALKAGDSLVGLTKSEIAAANWDSSKPGLPLFRKMIKDIVDAAVVGREAIRTAPDDVARLIQESKHRRVEDEVEPARIVGDAVIAAFFSADKKPAREKARQEVESLIAGQLRPDWDQLERKAKAFRAEKGWRPFHWEIEFPEAFSRDNPGFDAIVGNPPFLGGTWISGRLGDSYFSYLKTSIAPEGGRADLVAYFYRRAFSILREYAAFGLIATNTIRQGDTREAALVPIMKSGQITRAFVRLPWPGNAAVIVSSVHCEKNSKPRAAYLNNKSVAMINSFLIPGEEIQNPNVIIRNADYTFKGYDLLGMGFTFDDHKDDGSTSPISDMSKIQESSPREASRIFPYIGGEEINTDPAHSFHRYAINLSDFSYEECIKYYPNLLKIIEEKVKPSRDALSGSERMKKLKKFYWKYNENRPRLTRKLEQIPSTLACSQVSPHLAIARTSANILFANYCIVFTYANLSPFAVLQSRIHEIWARFFSSSMKDDLRYAPSDCFETFPFPPGYETDAALEAAGQTYHDHRAQLMIDADEGMTKTYNRFHKPEEKSAPIRTLRDLHDAMDRAVLCAYGWDDLAERQRPEFLTEETEDDHTYQGRYFWPAEARDEVLARLLALNAQRHAEEVAAGLVSADGKKTRRKAENDESDDDAQDEMKLD